MTHLPHWDYYYSLEDDLISVSRYVELSEENFETHSIHFVRLLLAAASEVDVVAKKLCGQILAGSSARNINEYCAMIVPAFAAIPTVVFGVSATKIRIQPWQAWGNIPAANPDWWRAYNDVKHERHKYFRKANLLNAMSAIAGLYCLIRHLREDTGMPKPTRFLYIAPDAI